MDTSMATVSSLSACVGHLPSGRQSFRKQRTVNPLMVPARYNFLYSSSRPALRAAAWGGRPRAATSQFTDIAARERQIGSMRTSKKRDNAVLGWHPRVARNPYHLAHDKGEEHAICHKLYGSSDEADIRLIYIIVGNAAVLLLPKPVFRLLEAAGYPINANLQLGIVLALLPPTWILALYWPMVTRKAYVIDPLLTLILYIDKNSKAWDSLAHRIRIVRRINRVARRIERIPRRVRATDPYVLKQLVHRAKECATPFRRLQVDVIMPNAGTRDALRKELSDRLVLLLDGEGWYRLPRTPLAHGEILVDAEVRRRTARTRLIASVTAAALIIAGAVLVVIFAPEAVAALTTPFLLSTAITTLGFGGIELKALGDSTTITQQALKSSSESSSNQSEQRQV